MSKKHFLNAALAAVLAFAATSSMALDEPKDLVFTNPKEAAVLDDLGLKNVRVITTLMGGNGESLGPLPFEADLKKWVDSALQSSGYKLTGKDSDPVVNVTLDCVSKRCNANIHLQRDVYLRRVDEGGQQYFLKLNGIYVSEFGSEIEGKSADEDTAAREAGYASVRAALLKFTRAVIEANHPDVESKFAKHFVISQAAAPEVVVGDAPVKKKKK